MPKASFGVNASVPEPTGVRAISPKGNNNSEMDFNDQGSSNEDTPGNGTRKQKRGEISPTGGKASPVGGGAQDGVINQGNSKISQPPQVTAEDIDIADDVAAIFEGSDLSEDFKYKAHAIFEAAVVAKVNEKLAEISEELEVQYNEALLEQVDDLNNKIDSYLNYVVEQWMEENRLAVTTGIRGEIAESFLTGLKTLFEDHYVDIPEEKVDVVDDLASRVEELEADLAEEIERNVSLNEQISQYERELTFDDVVEGLTQTQVAKLEALAEGVDFTTADEFRERLETLRESYFPSRRGSYTPASPNFDDEPIEDLNESTTGKSSDPNVSAYARHISKTMGRNK